MIRSIKFASILILFLVLFTISQILCRHFHVEFWISFIVSVMISLGFLGFCHLFNITNLVRPDMPKKRVGKANHTGECECCGKTGIPQELLFKINSGQLVCAACLKNMEQGN